MSALPFTIKADLDLGAAAAPWLRASGADVSIRRGEVPEALAQPESEGVAWQCAGERMLLRLPCDIRFLVEGGETVRYSMGPNAAPSDVRVFVLGMVWGLLALQRGLLPLRASAVLRDGVVHAFIGPSRAGKSMLAAALAQHGYALFTDDLLLLDPASFDAEPSCCGHRTLCLFRNGLRLMGVAAEPGMRIRRGVPKWWVVPARQAPPGAGRLRTLHWLRYWKKCPGESAPPDPERQDGADALQTLHTAVYNPLPAVAIVGRPRILHWLGRVARHTQTFDFLLRHCDEEDRARFNGEVARVAAHLPAP